MEESDKIISIFDEVQQSSTSHRSCLGKLSKVVDTMGTSAVSFILKNIMSHVLILSRKEPRGERVIDFFCKFCVTLNSTYLQECLNFMLSTSVLNDKTIRLRSCQIVAGIMNAISDADIEVPVDVLDLVEKSIFRRLRDKVPGVRIWAIRAIEVLQDPKNVNDKITTELLRLMTDDSSKDVRVAAIKAIIMQKASLNGLLDRIKDISPEVRIEAYRRMVKDIEIGHLKVPMRAAVIQFGLRDRDEAVRSAATSVIMKWLQSVNNDMPKLLTMISLLKHEDEAVLLGRIILSDFERSEDLQQDLIFQFREATPDWSHCKFSDLKPGELLWALIRCDFYGSSENKRNISQSAAEDIVQKLRPDTMKICELISDGYFNQDSESNDSSAALSQLSLKYLLRIAASNLDIGDVAGCSELRRLCLSLLVDWKGCPASVLEPAFSAWAKSAVGLAGVENNVKNAAEIVNDEATSVVSELWNPTGSDALVSIAFADPDIEDEIFVKKLRAVELATFSLQLSVSLCGNTEQPSGLAELCLPYVLEALQTPYEELRMASVRCLGLIGLSSDAVIKTIWDILLEVASEARESNVTRCWAIQGLSDLAMSQSDASLAVDSRLVALLLRCIDRSDLSPIVSRVSAEAAAKLLFSGVVSNPKLYGSLLKLFFADNADANETEELSRLSTSLGCCARTQQTLGVFFHAFYKAGQGREKIVSDSLPDFISDYCESNGDQMTSALSQVLSYLLSLSNDSSTDANPDASAYATKYHRSICTTALASIFRECLKSSHSQSDKKMIKELIHAISDLNTDSWINNNEMRYSIGSVAEILAVQHSWLDKSSRQILHKMIVSKREAEPSLSADDFASHRATFFEQAPGLAEIYDYALTTVDKYEDSAGEHLEEDAPKRKTKQLTKSRQTASNNDSDSNSEGEDDYAGSDNEISTSKGGSNVTVSAVPTRERIARGSKIVAENRMAKLVADENTVNERQHSALYESENQDC